jgi:4-amino-4-deoxy-L-arabinose transferase-like glycosyltransferase
VLSYRGLEWAVIGLVAAGAIILILIGTGNGQNLDPDSTNYISGARNLAAGRGYVNYALRPITVFPPGFSMTLALGQKLGIDALDGARWLNALAAGALVILTFLLALRHVRRRWLALSAAAAVGCAPAIFDVFSSAWSEPVFCVLVVGLLLILEPLMAKRAADPVLLSAAGLVASIGFAYRYVGVVLIVLPAVLICIVSWRDGVAATARRTAIYLLVAVVIPILVVARNVSDGSSAFGPRAPSIETLSGVTHELVATLRGWTLGPQRIPSAIGDVALLCAAAIVVLGLLVLFRDKRFAGRSVRSIGPLVVFLSGFLIYLVASELQTSLDPLDDRLLSPMFAPLSVLVVIAIESLVDLPWSSRQRWVVPVLAAPIAAWFVLSLAASANRARERAPANWGYAAQSWTRSAFVSAVRRLPANAVLFSNAAGALYVAIRRESIYDAPASSLYRSRDATNGLSAFLQQLHRTGQESFLAWANAPGPAFPPTTFTPTALVRAGVRLVPVLTTTGGTIYRIRL